MAVLETTFLIDLTKESKRRRVGKATNNTKHFERIPGLRVEGY